VQHQPELTAQHGQEIAVAHVGDLVGEHGPALLRSPARPLRGQKDRRAAPADRGGRDQVVGLAHFDLAPASQLRAQQVDLLQDFAVLERPASGPLRSHGQHAQSEPAEAGGHQRQQQGRGHGRPAPGTGLAGRPGPGKLGQECPPPQGRGKGAGLGTILPVDRLGWVRLGCGGPARVALEAVCGNGVRQRPGGSRESQSLQGPSRPRAQRQRRKDRDGQQPSQGHGPCGGGPCPVHRPIQRAAHECEHRDLDHAPHQRNPQGVHGFFSLRRASSAARSLAVSFRSSRSRTSNCSRDPRKTRSTTSPSRLRETSS